MSYFSDCEDIARAASVQAKREPARPFGDGHFPVLVYSDSLGMVIACQCGQQPRKLARRASMQHVWHQTHRRGLKLQPLEYVFPEWEPGVFSTGGYVRVKGHKWENGGWVRS